MTVNYYTVKQSSVPAEGQPRNLFLKDFRILSQYVPFSKRCICPPNSKESPFSQRELVVTRTACQRLATDTSPYRTYRLHCPPAAIFCPSFPFLYTSLLTFFCPKVSILRPFPFLRTSPGVLPTPSPSGSSSISDRSSSSSSGRSLFLPLLPDLLLPAPMFTFTLGGTENPKALPTLARSRALTSKIFFSEYDAYACRYDRYPSLAD